MRVRQFVYSVVVAAGLLPGLLLSRPSSAADAPGFTDKTVQVNGTSIHYQVGGHGSPLVLLHGYAQTGHMWKPHFWNDFAADKTRSVKEADRALYTRAYAQPGDMRAGFEYFRNFEQDAQDFAGFAQTRLRAPNKTSTAALHGLAVQPYCLRPCALP